MTERPMRDILAELDELRARVAAQERATARARRGRRRAGRLPAALALALLVALVPLSLFAATPFTDLDPGQDAGHNPNIDLIYNAGITTGCSPTEYCPKEVVTREQMASFLARTAGLGPNPPVANAKTAQTAAHATTADTATTALTAQPKFVRTVVVGPVGTPAENGAALLAAHAGITATQDTGPYLLKIEPGTYDLGTSALQMKPLVHIEGSGEGATIVTSAVVGDGPEDGTIRGVVNTELRSLTVQNTGEGAYGVALSYTGSSSAIIHVTARATGSATNSVGIGIFGSSASVQVVDSTARGTGFSDFSRGILVTGGFATIRNSIIVAEFAKSNSYGVFHNNTSGVGSSVTIDGSRIRGQTNALRVENGGLSVGASLVNGGGTEAGGGSLTCFATYKNNYTATDANCN